VSSVRVGYRLLRGEIPAPTLATGVRKYGRPRSHSADDLIGVLERIKCYGLVPEEPDLPGV
jgi:hypothetical protein